MAVSSAKRIGLWNGRTLTPAPSRIFLVCAAMCARMGINEGNIPYRLEWCSAIQIESKPNSSAY